MKRTLPLLAALAVATLILYSVSPAQAEVKGRYRIHLMSGNSVEGDVSELPDGSYEVKTKHGAIVKVKKGEVKAIVPLGEGTEAKKPTTPAKESAPRSPLRREITSEEIEQILSGVSAQLDESVTGASTEDLVADLPLDEDGLRDMMRRASIPYDPNLPLDQQKNVLIRPHFALVFTSSRDAAVKLAARMESVWRMNVNFVEQLKLKPTRPEHKLEVFYFKDFQEYHAYTTNEGTDIPVDAIGYYMETINRSHFFDLYNWPRFDGVKEVIKRKETPPEERQRLRNKVNAYVEYQNQATIQHELGHHIHFDIGVFSKRVRLEGAGAPTWLVEGTTMLFEVPPSASGTGGSGLGELNDERLNEFRTFPKWDPQSLRLFILDNSIWYQGGGLSYPKGWAIVYYLYKEKRAGYGKFIQSIWEREDTPWTFSDLEKLFTDCFGALDDKWVENFYKFHEKLQVRPSRLPPELH